METVEKVYQFAQQRNREGIILDTSLFLLFVIGKYNIDEIKDFEPTRRYSKDDFELLLRIIKPFKRIVVTPNIITEVSRHSLKYLRDAKLHQYLCMLADQLNDPNITREDHIIFSVWKHKTIPSLANFGFTDIGMFEISKEHNIPILTDDEDFYNFSKTVTPAIKFSILKYSHIKF